MTRRTTALMFRDSSRWPKIKSSLDGGRPRRRIALLAVAAVTVTGAVLVRTGGTALAHGSMVWPASRTYACYEDGRAGSGGGDLLPTNPACVDAVALGGKQPLWDWYGNLISNAGGRSREIISDGHLCGPATKYDAYNQ